METDESRQVKRTCPSTADKSSVAHFTMISQMWRSSSSTAATFRFAQLRAASFQAVETYPRRVPSHLRSTIKDSDLVGVFGEYKLFRARPDHIVLLKGPFSDFMTNEASCMAVGAKPHDEILWPFLYNITRYPFSFFALNENDEIVTIFLQDPVYRDNSKDPRPRLEIHLSDARDPFNLVGAVLGWAEQRHFERLGVEKLLQNEVAYVPSVLRRKKISGSLYPAVMAESVKLAAEYGLRYSIGVLTRDANAKNVAKLGYQVLQNEIVPKEIYKDFDGKPWKPAENERYACLCLLDLDLAREKKIFG